MAERERHQLVVGLGEGEDGREHREALDRAALDANKPVTVWAREILLTAAGSGPTDPLVEVKINGAEVTQLNLAAVQAVQTGWTNQVNAFCFGAWTKLTVEDPEGFVARWKRVIRTRVS